MPVVISNHLLYPYNKFRFKEGILGPKECHDIGFPGFSFCHIYPRLGVGEAGKLKMSIGTDFKKPKKSLLFLANGQRGTFAR